MSEQSAIAWLVICRWISTAEPIDDDDQTEYRSGYPAAVADDLMRRGWVEVDPDEDRTLRCTKLGRQIWDLHAPEFGIDPLEFEWPAIS